MKSILPSTLLLLSVLMMSSVSQAQDAITIPDGPYLGQKPPGSAPEPFAPGIVTTTGWEYGAVFTPDMKEFYFLRNNAETDKHELVVFQNKNNHWQQTGVSPRQGNPSSRPMARPCIWAGDIRSALKPDGQIEKAWAHLLKIF